MRFHVKGGLRARSAVVDEGVVMAKAADDEPSRRGAGMHTAIQGRRRGDCSKDERRVWLPVHLAMTHWRSLMAARVWSSSLWTSWRTSGLLSNVAWDISGVVERTHVPAAGSSRWKGCKVKSFWVPNFYGIKDVRRFINSMD
ncbi:hypothetical protein ACQJBY_043133 [Aegilops geniculata]